MSAIISPCGRYRYKLTRKGVLDTDRGPAIFIMLNPSTADADLDDPTIRRCRTFAGMWGCNGVVVGNLYAYRATNPDALWAEPDPVGPENDQHLVQLAAGGAEIVCAWGNNARADRVAQVVAILTAAGARMRCLGTTSTGAPRHPLYVPSLQPLIDWTPP